MHRPAVMLMTTLVLMQACGPSATEGGFESANPAARMYAIEQAARAGDRSAVRDLIEQLDSDDPGVRFLAISALERLSGETYGYRHYDPAVDRRDAIGRWIAAYDAGLIQPIVTTPGTTPSPAPSKPAAAPTSHG